MKSSMSAQPISILNKVRSTLNILSTFRSGGLNNPARDISFHRHLLEVAEGQFGDLSKAKPLRVLDFGCGQLAQQTALFHADGHAVTGVDMEVSTYRLDPAKFVGVWHANGIERALKSLARHVVFDRKFFVEMERQYGTAIDLDALDVRLIDGVGLPFDDHTFDFIVSSCVFEHVSDVPKVSEELARILKPTGVCFFAVHLFPSLSGGHNLEWHSTGDRTRERRAPAWDHLRDNLFPPNTYLNRLKLDDYKSIFGRYFTILNIEFEHGGEWALTSSLEAELVAKGYSRGDLLTELVFFTLSPLHA